MTDLRVMWLLVRRQLLASYGVEPSCSDEEWLAWLSSPAGQDALDQMPEYDDASD